jgi:hypothetical protein
MAPIRKRGLSYGSVFIHNSIVLNWGYFSFSLIMDGFKMNIILTQEQICFWVNNHLQQIVEFYSYNPIQSKFAIHARLVRDKAVEFKISLTEIHRYSCISGQFGTDRTPLYKTIQLYIETEGLKRIHQ